MSALPPYDPYSTCPKCGRTMGRSEKPPTAYCAGVVLVQPSGHIPPREEPCDHQASGEHLVRKCHECAFVWIEACVGVEPPLTGDEIAIFRALVAHQEPKA